MKTILIGKIISFIFVIAGCFAYPASLEDGLPETDKNDESVLRATLNELNANYVDKNTGKDDDISDQETVSKTTSEGQSDFDRATEQKVIESILRRSLREVYPNRNSASYKNEGARFLQQKQGHARAYRDIPDYEEDMYSLRAVPFLFKKRSYDDLDRDFDDSLGFLFKRTPQIKQNTPQITESKFDDQKRAEISALFKRRGVPFLFRRQNPLLVSRLLHAIKDDDRNLDNGAGEPSTRDLDFLFKKSSSGSRQHIDSPFDKEDDMNKRYEMSSLF